MPVCRPADPKKSPVAESVDELPRSVLRPNTYLLLDGEWQFAIDPDDQGLHQQWYVKHTYTATADWPGSIEDHLAQAKGDTASTGWHDAVVAWYERTFTLPERSESVAGSLMQLTFGACGYDTRVLAQRTPAPYH